MKKQVWLATLIAGLGCGGGGETESEIAAQFDRVLAKQVENRSLHCDCNIEPPCKPIQRDETVRQCYISVFESDPEVATAYLDCAAHEFDVENECLKKPEMCAAESATQTCNYLGLEAKRQCVLPDALSDALKDCR